MFFPIVEARKFTIVEHGGRLHEISFLPTRRRSELSSRPRGPSFLAGDELKQSRIAALRLFDTALDRFGNLFGSVDPFAESSERTCQLDVFTRNIRCSVFLGSDTFTLEYFGNGGACIHDELKSRM